MRSYLASCHRSSPVSWDIADREPGLFLHSLPTMPTKTDSLCCREFHSGLFFLDTVTAASAEKIVCAAALELKLFCSQIKGQAPPAGRGPLSYVT